MSSLIKTKIAEEFKNEIKEHFNDVSALTLYSLKLLFTIL